MNKYTWGIHLTVLPRDPDNTAHDPTQSATGTGQDEKLKPSEHAVKPNATDKKASDWKSTAYNAAKLAINLAKESADAFPPLKSVAGGLSAILDHCDVRLAPRTVPPTMLTAVLANNSVS